MPHHSWACQLARCLPFLQMGYATPWVHWGTFLRGRRMCDFLILCMGLYSPLRAGFWTSDLRAEAKPHVFATPVSVPSGILYKVLGYSESLAHSLRAHIVMQIAHPPRELGHHSPASVVVPLSARVCQLPGYHIDQPHSWQAGGGLGAISHFLQNPA